MRMYDIIEKKRDGCALSDEEIRFFIDGYTNGVIPDYQASALCMAIFFRGMTDREISVLTDAMSPPTSTPPAAWGIRPPSSSCPSWRHWAQRWRR